MAVTRVTLDLSQLKENTEKKQLRFSLKISINNLPIALLTGLRVKNNKLLLPSYNTPRGQALPLLYLYPEVLDGLTRMLKNLLHSRAEYGNFESAHAAPTERDELNALGEYAIRQEFVI